MLHFFTTEEESSEQTVSLAVNISTGFKNKNRQIRVDVIFIMSHSEGICFINTSSTFSFTSSSSISSTSSYHHGLQVSIDLHSDHLLVPGSCQVPLYVQMQVYWFQQLSAGSTRCRVHIGPDIPQKTRVGKVIAGLF